MVKTKNGWAVYMPTGGCIYFERKMEAVEFYLDTAIYKATMMGLLDGTKK